MKYILFVIVIAVVVLVFRAYMPPPPTPASGDISDKPVQRVMRIPNEVEAAWEEAWKESGEVQLYVKVASDGSECNIRGNAMPCADLIGHVERSLNLPKTTPIGLAGPPGLASSLRASLADALKRAGYSLVGVIDVESVAQPGTPVEESK